VADGDGLHFEMASAQQGAGADEGARRKILGKIGAIGALNLS